MAGLLTGSGLPLDVGRLLARGGQGEVFEVVGLTRVGGQPEVVFKRYLPTELAKDPSLPDRLALMLANRPSGWHEARSGHILLTWPTDIVVDDGRFVGCLMPRIDAGRTARLLRVSDPSDRETAFGQTAWLRGFTWRYLVGAAANLSFAVEALHHADVVIGDFNDANVAVTSEARVTLFDCDSMQITDPRSNKHFLCRVGRPDFTPPELVGVDLKTTLRPRSSDLFALAVHIHQLLLEGEHPFRGHWSGTGDPPMETILARDGLWTYAGLPQVQPRPAAVGIDLLPADIAALWRRAFVEGATTPSHRPSATEWKEALHHLATHLATCPTHSHHVYPDFHTHCPWCEHEARHPTQVRRRPPPPPPVRIAQLLTTPLRPAQPRPAQPQPAPLRPAQPQPAHSQAQLQPAASPARTAPPAPWPTPQSPAPPGMWPATGQALAPSPSTPTSPPRPWWSNLVTRRPPRQPPSRTRKVLGVVYLVLLVVFEIFAITTRGSGSSGSGAGSSGNPDTPYTVSGPPDVLDPQGAALAAKTPYNPKFSPIYDPEPRSGSSFAPAPGDIGKTETADASYVDGTYLITLDARVDNLPPDTGVPAPPSGERYEGFIFSVKNTGPFQSGEEVNDDVYVSPVGSTTKVPAGQNGDQVSLPVQCAGQGAFDLYPGQSVQVCATFEVPATEEFAAIYWEWHAGNDAGTDVWYLSSP